MLAFQFDVADLCTLRHVVGMQRRLPLFKPKRSEFVLIVENVNEGAIGGRQWQEFLGSGRLRDEDEDERKEPNPSNVSSAFVHAACRSPVR